MRLLLLFYHRLVIPDVHVVILIVYCNASQWLPSHCYQFIYFADECFEMAAIHYFVFHNGSPVVLVVYPLRFNFRYPIIGLWIYSKLRACSCPSFLIGGLGYLVQEILMVGLLHISSAHNLCGRFRLRISQNPSCAIFHFSEEPPHSQLNIVYSSAL